MLLPAPSRSEDFFSLTPEELQEDLDGEVEMPGGEAVQILKKPLNAESIEREPSSSRSSTS